MEKTKTAWLINGMLAIIFALLISNYLISRSNSPAHAEGGGWETHGVTVTTTNNANEQVFLIDTKNKNIMVYHSQGIGMLGLTGVRSYKYDVQIPEETARGAMGNGLTAEQVKKAVEAFNGVRP
jgi:hypothetical protein